MSRRQHHSRLLLLASCAPTERPAPQIQAVEASSTGQQQRLCIARATANRPMLILADEPTGELDSRTGQEILSLFRQIVALEGTALVVATHDPVIYDFATAVYELDDGRLTRSSHPEGASDG